MDPGARWGGYKQQLAVNNVTTPGRGHANRLQDKHSNSGWSLGAWSCGTDMSDEPQACLRFHPPGKCMTV